MEPRRGTIQRVDMNLDRRSQSRAGSVIYYMLVGLALVPD